MEDQAPPPGRCYRPSREVNRLRWLQRNNLRVQTGKAPRALLDNSKPWGPPPRSLAELLAISDAIERLSREMKQAFNK